MTKATIAVVGIDLGKNPAALPGLMHRSWYAAEGHA